LILGQRYTLRSDADERYVETLAEMIDGRMRELQRSTKNAAQTTPQSLAVLVALQLADELEREKFRRRELRRRVRDQAGRLRNTLARVRRDVARDDNR
jgi:cell division protein ZapA (FtsZ GTPase activity inhibitor)